MKKFRSFCFLFFKLYYEDYQKHNCTLHRADKIDDGLFYLVSQ